MLENIRWERVMIRQDFDKSRNDFGELVKGILFSPAVCGDVSNLIVISGLCQFAYFGNHKGFPTFKLLHGHARSGMGNSIQLLILPISNSGLENLITF